MSTKLKYPIYPYEPLLLSNDGDNRPLPPIFYTAFKMYMVPNFVPLNGNLKIEVKSDGTQLGK